MVGGEDGREAPGHCTALRLCSAPHDGRSSPETQWDPQPWWWWPCWGALMTCVALDTTSFPRTQWGNSPSKSTLLAILPSPSQRPLTQPQPSARGAPHSDPVLRGHLWLGRTWP